MSALFFPTFSISTFHESRWLVFRAVRKVVVSDIFTRIREISGYRKNFGIFDNIHFAGGGEFEQKNHFLQD